VYLHPFGTTLAFSPLKFPTFSYYEMVYPTVILMRLTGKDFERGLCGVSIGTTYPIKHHTTLCQAEEFSLAYMPPVKIVAGNCCLYP